MDQWRDLSDAELRARLIQRGVDDPVADLMVKDREDEESLAVHLIEKALG